MTLDEFSEITYRVIANDGFEEYLPTVCYPVRREIKVLTDLPLDAGQEKAILGWASESAGVNEEFLIAFKTDSNHFKVIRRIGPYSEEQVYAVS